MLEIEFDRPDRRYRFGELVSGRVLVRVKKEMKPGTKVWIHHGWYTHGKGNMDRGPEEKLQVSGEYASFPPGKTVAFPFRFNAPNGPASYHGHYLNIDWYVTAYLTQPAGLLLKRDVRLSRVEQDFLLLGGRTQGPIQVGSKQFSPVEAPRPLLEFPPDPAGLVEVGPTTPADRLPRPEWDKFAWMTVPFAVLLFVSLALNILLGPASSSRNLAFLMALGALFASLYWIYRTGYKRRLDMTEMWVRPAIFHAGSFLKCHISFRTRRKTYLRQIKATLYAREFATSTSGTKSVTMEKLVYNKTFLKLYEEQLEAGRSLQLDSFIPIGPDSPPTFLAANNRLEWKIRVDVDLKGWPGWVQTISLTVLPPILEEFPAQQEPRIPPSF